MLFTKTLTVLFQHWFYIDVFAGILQVLSIWPLQKFHTGPAVKAKSQGQLALFFYSNTLPWLNFRCGKS